MIKNENIGIWMDSDKSIILNEKEKIDIIFSNIEHFNLHGGAKGKHAYSAQDARSETKLLERKKLQTKRYFDKVIAYVADAHKIVVFGPAETKLDFAKKIGSMAEIKDKFIGVETVHNKLTENQLTAWVRNFYSD